MSSSLAGMARAVIVIVGVTQAVSVSVVVTVERGVIVSVVVTVVTSVLWPPSMTVTMAVVLDARIQLHAPEPSIESAVAAISQREVAARTLLFRRS